MFQVRLAKPADAAAVAEIAEKTFRATFAVDNVAQDMDQYCELHFGIEQQKIEIESPHFTTLLMEDNQTLIAFAQLRWAVYPSCVPSINSGEIYRFYVLDSYHGQGVAAKLMETALSHFRQRGNQYAWLGVWEHNPRAIKFYQKFGFKNVGEQVFKLGDDRQRDEIMACQL